VRRWCRWGEAAQFGVVLIGHGIAEPIEPGAGIQVCRARGGVPHDRAVGVSHHDHTQVGVLREQSLGPLPLPLRGDSELSVVHGVIAQMRAEQVHQTQPEFGVQCSINRRRSGMVDQPVKEGRPAPRLGQAVAVDRRDFSSADVKR
jgi:hypothetical protein